MSHRQIGCYSSPAAFYMCVLTLTMIPAVQAPLYSIHFSCQPCPSFFPCPFNTLITLFSCVLSVYFCSALPSCHSFPHPLLPQLLTVLHVCNLIPQSLYLFIRTPLPIHSPNISSYYSAAFHVHPSWLLSLVLLASFPSPQYHTWPLTAPPVCSARRRTRNKL